ncbi:MAG: 4-(cytidine 5'-diphospho)-2-C-methyl-D-erythritol kinase [Verrucomicrobiota bacterium]
MTTASLTLLAPAKINLSLRIVDKREDGYHEIETLMAPLALADEIELCHAHGAAPGSVTLTCSDPTLPTDADNLCVKAAHLFQTKLGIQEAVLISLLKKIPHGAGLGGGSSDAAAVLRGMNTLFDEPFVFEELHQLATLLGSDVSFFLAQIFHASHSEAMEKANGTRKEMDSDRGCMSTYCSDQNSSLTQYPSALAKPQTEGHEISGLNSKPAWCRGRGELLSEASPLPAWKLLLIKPPFGVASAEAYSRLKRMEDQKGVRTSQFINEVMNCRTDPFLLDGISIFNDLEAPVFEKYLQLPILKSWLQARPEVAAAWMTGSGSTMVAALKKKISTEETALLKKEIATEFGATFWIKETNFA